ncbi:uncharacterized protein LOC111808389 isoform X1 [Cucurbita pepo subsp. pepo]|uniref:uncharacterized protein LOC111808389 isoform X1 n=1 Tax=Cucurbita pepo subsp. pepo TaxID=3664 RepID=UPI000C9D7B19|nr:uncharacterized protein LOC111808389 isoform X1 [Cucurbita pepo subsp. pepo]
MSTSDYNAIVPIKKRRFPSMQSPPPKEISSLPLVDDNIAKVDEPCVSDGPTVSNSSTITTSEFSEKKISFSEDGKRKSDLCNMNMVQSIIGPSRVEFQENDVCSTGCVENKETCMVNENHALVLHEKPEFKLPHSDANSNPGLCAEKESDEIDRKQLDRLEFSTSVAKKEAELSIGSKEHLVPDSVLEGSDLKSLKQINLEPGLLNLSLSKEGSLDQPLTVNVGSSYDGSIQESNRENWDLNTSMEFWEGCSSGDPPEHVPAVQTNTVVTMHRFSTEMVNTDTLSGKLTPLDDSDHLHLSLSSSDHRHVISQEQSSFVKLGFRKTSPSLSSTGRGLQFDDLNGALKVVKPEPFVEASKLESKSDEVNVLGLSDSAIVKREFLQIPNASDIYIPMNTVKAKSVNSESNYESKQVALETLGGRLDLVAKQVLPEVDSSCPAPMPFVAEMTEAAGNSCSTDLITDGGMSNHSELQTPTEEHLNLKVHEGAYRCGGELVDSEMTDISKDPGSKDFNSPIIKPIAMPRNPSRTNDSIIEANMSSPSELHIPTTGPLNTKVHQAGYGCDGGLVNSVMTDVSKDTCSKDSSSSVIKPVIVEDENQNNPLWRPSTHTNEQCSSLQGGEESSVNDEEKISLSADLLEEDPYSSEYESDGKLDVNEAMDAVDNDIEEDYEDGEVREPTLTTQVESSICETKKVKNFDHGDSSNGLPGSDCCSSLVSVKQENKLEILDVKREDNLHSVTSNQSSEQERSKELPVEEHTTRVCLNKANKAKTSALEDQETSPEKASNGIEESITTVSQSDAEKVKTVDIVRNDNPALPNVEPLNDDDVTDDITRGSKHSRIVSPCKPSSSSLPSKTKSSLARSVLTQTDRERIPDMGHEGEKLHPQGRDEPYRDVFQRFYVNRHQNLSPQTNFSRRRGRFTIRINSVQGEWDFNPTISPGNYNDQVPPPYDARRRKYMPAVSDDDIDQNHYKMKPDGPFRSAGDHRGRQILDDEGPLFCHMASRRKSPGRRDGPPPVRGVKMVHRMPRNISPSRCNRERGSELVGPRHGEKFMRTFEDETMDPLYAHPQPSFEVDRPPFIRDRRNFPIQRKSFQRVDSKSPGRSRGRSPSQWFPSKRKSERFFGHPEMARRSPPPGYRMRSPDQPPQIHGDMPDRRHGFPFPSLPPNDLRDMGSARDHGHMRPGLRSRNRTDRMSFRNRRFEDMDPRDNRIESNEYFDGPVHPGQMNELIDDGNDDDRRRFSDRHEHLHQFRPQCNDSDGENYHNDADERARPYRYCTEDEEEFHERGKMREREFDRRVKNQPENLGRRTVIEEHEVEEYRHGHGRQMWNEHHHHHHHHSFEDISRMKRKRI